MQASRPIFSWRLPPRRFKPVMPQVVKFLALMHGIYALLYGLLDVKLIKASATITFLRHASPGLHSTPQAMYLISFKDQDPAPLSILTAVLASSGQVGAFSNCVSKSSRALKVPPTPTKVVLSLALVLESDA
ncbi:jumonji family transcription [Moniliophthora roreri]|nr:jumonji family transcription [Moniliophthora roreri]